MDETTPPGAQGALPERGRTPMSLWTPGGEVPVNRSGDPEPEPQVQPEGPSLEDLSPEERAQAEEMLAQMAEVQRQILAVPASRVVANHVMGFYELAAIHLAQEDADLDEASLAVDAMAAVLDVAGDRLGEDGLALRQALGQLQMAFVARSEEADGA